MKRQLARILLHEGIDDTFASVCMMRSGPTRRRGIKENRILGRCVFSRVAVVRTSRCWLPVIAAWRCLGFWGHRFALRFCLVFRQG